MNKTTETFILVGKNEDFKSAETTMEINFVTPEENQPPVLLDKLKDLIIDESVYLKPGLSLYKSEQAHDIEKDAITLTLTGLDEIPCKCFMFVDNGDGTFDIKADIAKLADQQSNGLFIVGVNIADDFASVLTQEKFFIEIDIQSKETRFGQTYKIKIDQKRAEELKAQFSIKLGLCNKTS